MSCATILASELDFPETAFRYPSYAPALSEMLETSIARFTATKKFVRCRVYIQRLQPTLVEGDKFVTGHPSGFQLINLLC